MSPKGNKYNLICPFLGTLVKPLKPLLSKGGKGFLSYVVLSIGYGDTFI